MVHTGLAVTGISLIVASSPVLFKILAVAGAAYLAWLGLQGFRDGGAVSLDAHGKQVGMARARREATLCNVLNPKVIVLFLALLPNFVDTERDDVTAQLITLAIALIMINVVWQVPMVWLADGIRRWLGRPDVIRALSRITGGVLLALSAYMLVEHLG
jgi:threonine/homoserine/homoserine lactone efflux protein